MEPIIALATPPLKAALALFRLTGDGVFDAVARSLSLDVSSFAKKRIHVGYLKHENKVIDQIVAFVYPGPNSYTGEDVVEICCHGSTVIANEILTHFYSLGVRQAERGEFSARGFYNGKFDLVEAEAINDLINAPTVEAKNVALLSLEGKTSSLLKPICDQIDEMLALIEVNIDYPEYTDIEEVNTAKVLENCKALVERLSLLISDAEQGKIIREGVKVAIVGEPNVGKSSLLNALIDENKAIVTAIPGTTRDVVEGEISLYGVPVKLLDTAGIRESDDVVESIGVQKSIQALEEADIVVLVKDPTITLSSEIEEMASKKNCIVVYNKADLLDEREDGVLYISALHKDIDALKHAIYKRLNLGENAYKTPSFSNARELGLLVRLSDSLKETVKACEERVSIDLISSVLQEARMHANQLLGKDASIDLGEEIFSRFCVGK